jgi:gamma-glutamylaminecyclotransferase
VAEPNHPPSEEFLLFVYGTLMHDGPRAVVLSGQRLIGNVRTVPGFALYDLGPYPALVRQEGAGAVHGELLSVAADLREYLDQVEGAPDLYRLEDVNLEGVAGTVYAYLYQGSVEGASPITSGRWDNRRAAPWSGSRP